METERINVLIVDDEHFVREGLRHIIDWDSMGFCICDEAGNGEEALRKIRIYQPELVLLDVRMPKMYGTDLMQTVRSEGFAGEFIILSGYSDFKYAQAALHCGASYYLTKPIVEAELTRAVLDIRDKILGKRKRSVSMDQFRTKARSAVLHDLLTQEEFNTSINYEELGISASIYQVVIHEAYEICCRLMKRRFFCSANQHVLSYEMLPQPEAVRVSIEGNSARIYGQRLTDYIKSGNQHRIRETLKELEASLYNSQEDVMDIKYFLADIFLQIKQEITHSYPTVNIPLPYNAAILKLIEDKYYLYEILDYFREQCSILIRTLGTDSGESVFDSILDYIAHNYEKPLKLENIATLFGYNSSYLGKLFSQKMGMNFNAYLDQIRISEAARLLTTGDLKVYEVAARVGFKNVDYFHRKFRKIMNQSPAEYRKN